MTFRTKINTPSSALKIDYRSGIFFAGSCFSEHISKKLSKRKFDVVANPFGIVYNPLSVAAQLNKMLSGTNYEEDDLSYHNDRWFSFDHHGVFSDSDKKTCLENINTSLREGAEALSKADFVFITFGTSWVFEKADTKNLVSNCHKLPGSNFNRRPAETSEMVAAMENALTKIYAINHKASVVLSISPVRHLRDGFFGNNLSKGRLFEVVNQLQNKFENSSYFPAYEMLIDDLRDYRFYADDLLHPSSQGIQYVWEHFQNAYISDAALAMMKRVEKILRASAHRLFDTSPNTHREFAKKQLAEIEKLKLILPGNFIEEKRYFRKLSGNR